MYDAAYLSVYPFFEKAFRDRPLSAVLDSLTGVVSRACMIEFLHDLVDRKQVFTVGMIDVDKIEDIRRRRSRGESIAGISRNTGVSEPTVRKYLRMEDLSPSRPGRRIAESELLEPYEATIDAWLLDGCRNWRKQLFPLV